MEKLNTWITLAANIGVLAGIIFLAFEIQQNTNSIQAQTRTQLTEQNLNGIELLMDPGLQEILLKVQANEELTPIELGRRQLLIDHHLRGAENIFYQYRAGTFIEGEFEGYRNRLIRSLSLPDYRRYWLRQKNMYSADFQEEIDLLYEGIQSN